MTTAINFKREISSTLDVAIERVTNALKGEGFGVLTRIDLHSKIKEKIGKDLRPVVILGACNPQLAYEAFQRNRSAPPPRSSGRFSGGHDWPVLGGRRGSKHAASDSNPSPKELKPKQVAVASCSISLHAWPNSSAR